MTDVTHPPIHASFPRIAAPGTGRTAIQLTSGRAFNYPLYYYIPSLTRDGRYLVHHQALDGEVQLQLLDLVTGETRRLTQGTASDTWWRPWCVPAGRGVLDHRSVLNVARDEVIVFDGQDVRVIGLHTGSTRDLLRLPDDRLAIGQNCVTPDGRWFVFIHADRARYEALFEGDPDYEGYWARRGTCRDTRLVAVDLDTGEQRTLLVITSPIHHVLAYDDRHLLFCHPAAENGMLLTDLDGGWSTHLRTQDDQGGQICHFLGTARGATYEVLWRPDRQRAGIIDPFSRRAFELDLPEDVAYVHTGRDPDGLLWLFENQGATHDLRYLARHDPVAGDTWRALTGDWPTFGDPDGQKAHFHPQVVLDRRHVLLTAGDPATGTNQLFLLDISDVPPTAGIPRVDLPPPA